MITWLNVREFGHDEQFDMQVQLDQYGNISVAYNSLTNVQSHTALVGVTQGGGAAPNPGDLSLPHFTHTPTLHEGTQEALRELEELGYAG